MMTHTFHEVSSIFPLMQGEEFRHLVGDIKQHGLREPIWLYQDKIIDGRNRYLACQEVGIEADFRQWDEVGSLVAFIVSLNLHRRHLDEGQRAMVAAKIANMRQGARTDLEPSANLQEVSQPEAADLLNVSTRSVTSANKVLTEGVQALVDAVEQGAVAVSVAADIATLSKDEQGKLLASEEDILKASKEIRAKRAEGRRQERFEKFAELPELTLDGKVKYPIIYADPPWRYDYAESDSRVIENQYPTMDLDEICALPVASLATEDCVLFLWATSPKLEESLQVLNAWGFSYRTCMVWVKDKFGMGYYCRQQHELLLIAKRGEPPMPNPSDRPSSVITAPRGEHSAKPEEFYLAIEQMYPEIRKLELFARGKREGWDRWGNQA